MFIAQFVKVHYINVDYLSSEGDTAGVDLLFTDKVPNQTHLPTLHKT